MNKGQKRPYVGIVLQVNEFDYYVPLESPKPNHVNIKSGGPVLKLQDGKLGIMGFNNMIPVEKQYLIEFDIKSEKNDQYKRLLYNQLSYCQKHIDTIYLRAKNTYDKVVSGETPFYVKVCCDFKKLEESAKLYKAKSEK